MRNVVAGSSDAHCLPAQDGAAALTVRVSARNPCLMDGSEQRYLGNDERCSAAGLRRARPMSRCEAVAAYRRTCWVGMYGAGTLVGRGPDDLRRADGGLQPGQG